MKLKLSPQRSDKTVTYKRDGDNFIVNDNEPIDLSGDWVKLEADNEESTLEPTGPRLTWMLTGSAAST